MPPHSKLNPNIPMETLMDNFNRGHDVVVVFQYFNERIWLRFSGGIFNSRTDFANLKNALVKEFIDD